MIVSQCPVNRSQVRSPCDPCSVRFSSLRLDGVVRSWSIVLLGSHSSSRRKKELLRRCLATPNRGTKDGSQCRGKDEEEGSLPDWSYEDDLQCCVWKIRKMWWNWKLMRGGAKMGMSNNRSRGYMVKEISSGRRRLRGVVRRPADIKEIADTIPGARSPDDVVP